MQEAQWTRARLLRGALAGGALLAGGGALLTGRSGAAEPSEAMDEEILGFLLGLEQLQTDFYRQALSGGRLEGDLRSYADTVARQEEQHARFLADRIGSAGGTRERPEADFREALASAEAFTRAAIDLEEAALAAYVAHGASLRRETLADVAPLASVEARQAAWIRDLAGVNPAPNAADPGASPDDVLAGLRDKGLIK